MKTKRTLLLFAILTALCLVAVADAGIREWRTTKGGHIADVKETIAANVDLSLRIATAKRDCVILPKIAVKLAAFVTASNKECLLALEQWSAWRAGETTEDNVTIHVDNAKAHTKNALEQIDELMTVEAQELCKLRVLLNQEVIKADVVDVRG